MSSEVIIRKVDGLGRVVIPRKIRKELNIYSCDQLSISVKGEKIHLTKVEPNCIFCNSSTNVVSFKEASICESCLVEMKTF